MVAWSAWETVAQDWTRSVRALEREVGQVSEAPVVPAALVAVLEREVLDSVQSDRVLETGHLETEALAVPVAAVAALEPAVLDWAR